eukprot:gene1844-24268_t
MSYQYQTGDSVKIKWGTQWYAGSILGVTQDAIRVIYKQDSTFDVIKRAQAGKRLKLVQAGAFEGFQLKQVSRETPLESQPPPPVTSLASRPPPPARPYRSADAVPPASTLAVAAVQSDGGLCSSTAETFTFCADAAAAGAGTPPKLTDKEARLRKRLCSGNVAKQHCAALSISSGSDHRTVLRRRRVGDRISVVYAGVRYPGVVVEETSAGVFSVKYDGDPVLGKNLTVAEHSLLLVERAAAGGGGGVVASASGSKRRKVDSDSTAPSALNRASTVGAAGNGTSAAANSAASTASTKPKEPPKLASNYYDSWSLGTTKDGRRHFFFNRATGAVRWAGAEGTGPMEGLLVNYGAGKQDVHQISCSMRAGSKVASVDIQELQKFLYMQKQPVLTKEAATRILARQRELEAKLLQAQQHAYHYKYILNNIGLSVVAAPPAAVPIPTLQPNVRLLD